MWKPALSIASVLFAFAAPARAETRMTPDGVLIRDDASCGTTQEPAAIASFTAPPPPHAVTAPRTLYLNKNGGTYNIAAGATNATTNTASTIAAGDGRTHANAVVPPIESTFNWPKIVACVKEHYKPYNILITEAEPVSGNYIEVAVGGSGSSTGWSASSGILGVASADNFCGVTEKGIAFVFSTNHRGASRADDELCATIAHEAGHLLALEHEVAPKDTMSYTPIASSQTKAFLDENSQCGTVPNQPRSCSCQTVASGMTNSAVRLRMYLGLRSMETVPPTLDVTDPDGGTVPPMFTVTAKATDNELVADVSAFVDGVAVASDTQGEADLFKLSVRGIAEGDHMLEVKATDAAGNITSKTIPIKVALSATGASCTAAEQCKGNVCAAAMDGNFCTQACDMANDTCPEDFACHDVGGQTVCVPSDEPGCNATGENGGGPVWLLSGLGLAVMLIRRRHRSPTPR